MASVDSRQLALLIDHTKLTFGEHENALESIATLCEEAKRSGFFSVCVRPQHVAYAKQCLQGSSVKVATVIGFPPVKVKLQAELVSPSIGHFSTAYKLDETQQAIADAVDELDLVIDVAALKADVKQGSTQVLDELKAIGQASAGRMIKVIIEADLLTPEEIVAISHWCAEAGMGMVKTSTGMVDGGKGATLEHVRLIRSTLDKAQTQFDAFVGIKASGGIKTREDALAFMQEGVNRIGTSSGVAILAGDNQAAAQSSY